LRSRGHALGRKGADIGFDRVGIGGQAIIDLFAFGNALGLERQNRRDARRLGDSLRKLGGVGGGQNDDGGRGLDRTDPPRRADANRRMGINQLAGLIEGGDDRFFLIPSLLSLLSL
jgi:hypothetical protein